MKATLFALFVALLMAGCESPNLENPESSDKIIPEAIYEHELQRRETNGEQLVYAPNQQTPYTGGAKSMHTNGQKYSETNYKDGKKDGLDTNWYENGQKWSETNYKDGELEGLDTWWYENGQKRSEELYKDGKLWDTKLFPR